MNNNFHKSKNRVRKTFNVAMLSVFLLGAGVSVSTHSFAQNKTAEIVFWESVEKMNTIDGYLAYLEKYPKGDFSSLAAVKIKSMIPANSSPTVKQENPKDAVSSSAVSSSVPGEYKAKFHWKKGAYNSYYTEELFCETVIKIEENYLIKEKKITCPYDRQPTTEWYFRGEANKEGKIPKSKVWHAYNIGEYYMSGNTNKIQSNKESKSWWNLYIDLQKIN